MHGGRWTSRPFRRTFGPFFEGMSWFSILFHHEEHEHLWKPLENISPICLCETFLQNIWSSLSQFPCHTYRYICMLCIMYIWSISKNICIIYIYTNPITLPQITAVISRELPISFIQLRFSESPPGRLQTSPRWPLCVVINFICWDLGIFQGGYSEVGIPVDYLRHFPQKRSTTFSREFPRVLGRKLLSPKGSAAHFVHRRRNFGSVDQFSSRCLRKA